MEIRCPICDVLFNQNQLRDHCASHRIPMNGVREGNSDDYHEFISNCSVLLTHVEILRLFAKKLRNAYTELQLVLLANNFPARMIPRIAIETLNFATAMKIHFLPAEAQNILLEVPQIFLEDIGFGDLQNL